MENQNLLNEPLLQLGATSFTLGNMLLAGIVVLVLCLAIFLIAAARSARLRAVAEAQAEDRARDAEYRMAEILKAQAEMQGRMQTMAEVFGSRQAELNQSIRERLDGMTHRIGQTMTEQTRSTHENLAKLQERLAVIDTAQNNIQSLAGQVVQLPRQQADARRFRPVAHGSDHRRWPAARRLRVPGNAFQQHPSRLPCADAEQCALAGDRREISARGLEFNA